MDLLLGVLILIHRWCACDGETPETIEHEPDCFVGKMEEFLAECATVSKMERVGKEQKE